MRSKLKVITPDAIEMEMTITMPLGEWKKLKEQLESQSYPSWPFKDAIRDLIQQAERHFYPSLSESSEQ